MTASVLKGSETLGDKFNVSGMYSDIASKGISKEWGKEWKRKIVS